MKRKTTTETFHTLLRRAHAARPAWRPDQAWRDAVLDDAARLHASAMNADLDRLVPRLTLAATAVSGVSLLTAAWVLRDLSAQILAALTCQALHFGMPGLGI